MSAFWLFKSEPSSFSISDLQKSPKKTTCWEGVRNYQARNYLKTMEPGDLGFFYHSNADPPSIVGTVKVVRSAYPDRYALDPHSRYFDPRSTSENPRWFMVDIRLMEIFPKPLPLEQLRTVKGLNNMELLRKGSRLSVQPVSQEEWEEILRLVSYSTQIRS